MSRVFGKVLAGGTWLFLAGLVFNLFNFIYWFLITRIAGVSIIGLASTVYSSAIIASTIVSSGLDIAVMREVSSYGLFLIKRIFPSILIISMVSFVLSYMLTLIVGFDTGVAVISGILAFLNVISVILLAALIGSTMFKHYFIALTTSSVLKLLVGIFLILFGFGLYSLLFGFMAYLLASIVLSIYSIYSTTRKNIIDIQPNEASINYNIFSFFKIGYSNYFFTITNQILTYIFTYTFMFIVRKAIDTGTLYISIMIITVISMFPQALLNASLPISIREKTDEISSSLRLGIAISGFLCISLLPVSTDVLAILNQNLTYGEETLNILILSVPFMVGLTTYLMKWNKELKIKNIIIVGFTRLLTLLVLLVFLASHQGIIGAALSYLVSNIISYFVAYMVDKKYLKAIIFTSIFLMIEYLMNHVISLKMLIPIIIAIYALLIFRLKIINIAEAKLFKNIVKEIIKNL